MDDLLVTSSTQAAWHEVSPEPKAKSVRAAAWAVSCQIAAFMGKIVPIRVI
ncbi:hypothetical protein [Marivivens donghaensis]|uniref:hypothetical protein n=1 Tax=Marivivens donghaensis TaxID=1699413 RepID=UPI00201F11F9|nr:hypothetical protein [Marivivens donghaensis]MCL7407839.1 hypothetical protein [Marivivens donghaensis]MDN3704182.1 hypothetical protein [Marivivens donghaensis]